ncbi:MAG: hypothetical protein D3909_17620, partial [Candidatus Electrothrix sp. ATG1]|nr:hypothetical protein [Candidatus Electrothrix sp. ATG1]
CQPQKRRTAPEKKEGSDMNPLSCLLILIRCNFEIPISPPEYRHQLQHVDHHGFSQAAGRERKMKRLNSPATM